MSSSSSMSTGKMLSYLVGAWLIKKYIYDKYIRPKHDITGKTALVTGAGMGMGRNMSIRLSKLGVGTLLLWDINEAGLLETERRIRAAVGNSKLIIRLAVVDVSDRDAVFRAAAECPTPDILILNAGIVRGNEWVENKLENDVRKVFGVNVFQLFWLTAAFLPRMLQSDGFGKIVTIASSAGMGGAPRLSDYCASKFAALGFAETLNTEMKKRGFKNKKTSVVCPYFINTGMFTGFKDRFGLRGLKEDDVAELIVSECVQADVEQLCVPSLIYAVPLLKCLPPSISYPLGSVLGVWTAMDEFDDKKRITN